MGEITRALISVSDKRGVVEFARRLQDFGVEILSTGGTAKVLMADGVAVQEDRPGQMALQYSYCGCSLLQLQYRAPPLNTTVDLPRPR